MLVGWGKAAGQTGNIQREDYKIFETDTCWCVTDTGCGMKRILKLFFMFVTEPPFRQQMLRLPILNIQQCANIYGRTLPVSEENICAGGERGIDACTGFGGAPLLVRHGDIYYQVG